MSKSLIYAKTVIAWNTYINERALEAFLGASKDCGLVRELQGSTVALLLDEGNRASSDSIFEMINNILAVIRNTDRVRHAWVKRYVSNLCVSNKIPRSEFDYDVYTKTLFARVPFSGYDEDPEWIIGEVACFIVERAAFGKIFWNSYAHSDKEKHARISRILSVERAKFGRKLGDPWKRYYENLGIENHPHTPLFRG